MKEEITILGTFYKRNHRSCSQEKRKLPEGLFPLLQKYDVAFLPPNVWPERNDILRAIERYRRSLCRTI